MQLLNDSPETRRVFLKHAKDPKYPKHLKLPELLAQIERVPDDLFSSVIQLNRKGDSYSLASSRSLRVLFVTYVKAHDCACWSSWEKAWVDFMEFEREWELKAVKTALQTSDQEDQRRSFAYGNTKIGNDRITRDMVDRQAVSSSRKMSPAALVAFASGLAADIGFPGLPVTDELKEILGAVVLNSCEKRLTETEPEDATS